MAWSVLCSILERDLLQVSKDLFLFLCSSFRYSVLWTLATWVFPDSQLYLFNSGSSPGSTWVLPLCTMAWKLSQDSNLRKSKLVLSHFSEITVLHCLIFSVLKIIVSCILFVCLLLFQAGWKFILCYFILARSRSPLTFYNPQLSWPIIISSLISILIFQKCRHHHIPCLT